MSAPELAGLLILGFLWGAQLWQRSFAFAGARARRRAVAAALAAAIFVLTFVIVVAQYETWRADPVSQFLLPPHRSWIYFALYVLRRIVAPWLIAGAAGMALAWAARRLNAGFGERFFEEEEPFFFGIAAFLAGYPAFLLYVLIMFLGGLLLSLAYAVLGKGRAPLYYLWLPAAIFAILITHFAVDASVAAKFNM